MWDSVFCMNQVFFFFLTHETKMRINLWMSENTGAVEHAVVLFQCFSPWLPSSMLPSFLPQFFFQFACNLSFFSFLSLSVYALAHKGVYLLCATARLHLPLSRCTVLASMWASPRKPSSGVSNTVNALQ